MILKNANKGMQNSDEMGSIGENFTELKRLNQDVDKETLVELYNYLLMKHFRMMRNEKVRESEESKSTDAFTLKQKSCVLSENSSFVFTDL